MQLHVRLITEGKQKSVDFSYPCNKEEENKWKNLNSNISQQAFATK